MSVGLFYNIPLMYFSWVLINTSNMSKNLVLLCEHFMFVSTLFCSIPFKFQLPAVPSTASDRLDLAETQRSLVIEWFAAALTHLWRFPAQFNLALLINIALLASSDGQWMLIELLPGLIVVLSGFGEASCVFPSVLRISVLNVTNVAWICVYILHVFLLF